MFSKKSSSMSAGWGLSSSDDNSTSVCIRLWEKGQQAPNQGGQEDGWIDLHDWKAKFPESQNSPTSRSLACHLPRSIPHCWRDLVLPKVSNLSLCDCLPSYCVVGSKVALK